MTESGHNLQPSVLTDFECWSSKVTACDSQYACKHAQLLQSCPTLCDPMDCSPPGSSVHGILQARIPEWVTIPFSRGSSWPRGWTQADSLLLSHQRSLDSQYIDFLFSRFENISVSLQKKHQRNGSVFGKAVRLYTLPFAPSPHLWG